MHDSRWEAPVAIVLSDEGEDVQVELASSDEIEAGYAAELDALGLTYEELAEQAAEDEFSSEQARSIWFMIEPLGRSE